jgi:hypothetical protein
MESNFNNRDFEQYVKRNADQYRMIPSEKVWKGINNALHTRRRWYGIGLGLLLLLTAVSVTWVMVSYPVSKKQELTATKNILPGSTEQPSPGSVSKSPSEEISKLLAFNNFDQPDNTSVSRPDDVQPLDIPENNTESLIAENKLNEPLIAAPLEKAPGAVAPDKKAGNSHGIFDLTNQPESFNPVVSDERSPANKIKDLPGKTAVRSEERYFPLTIESVVNAYHAKKIRKHLIWQLYFTPTVSYRKLTENKSYQEGSSPFEPAVYPFASLTGVNKAVVHKPDLGLELGFTTRYPLTKNLNLRGGLQFNINRYDIKAFVYNGEQATINLSGGNGNNSVTAWTYYRNYNGYKSDWLKNFYFSVSAPLGAELKLFGNDKTNFGIAGTVQPTYILSDRAYLISTDYKNYAEVPWLIRHLNVNTSFETFISYTTHRTKWQVGPQVRYQVLSSFQNKYPVKENLFDFGLKVGVTLNQ